ECLRRRAAGVDARPAEELPFDEGHRHAGGGEASRKRRAGLAGADDDRVEPSHRIATPISSAPPMATASSVKAAGRSLPNAAASFARNARPPRVPTTPARNPPAHDPPAAPIVAPER